MNQEQFPQEPTQAELNAERAYNAHAAEWDEMIAERNFEVAQAEDQAAYDSTRLYRDASGFINDPENGRIVKPDVYHDAKRSEHYKDSLGTSYEEMNPLELARELAKAELSEDRTKTETLTDILLDKVAAQAEKTSNPNAIRDNDDDERITRRNREMEITEKLAQKHGESNDPQIRLLDKVINYKDKYKESLSAVKGQTEEDRNQEIRDRIDYDYVGDIKEYLESNDAPVGDIMKEIPKEALYKDTTEEDSNKLLPDSYWKVVDSDPDVMRNRVDKNFAERSLNALKAAGVPDEILQTIPAEYFYPDSDPDVTDDEGEVFNTWLKDNPDVEERLNGSRPKAATTAGNNVDSPKPDENDKPDQKPEPTDPQPPKQSVWARVKDRWNRQAAVTFDKQGNAIVNEELAGVDIDKKTAIALGVAAVGFAAAYFSARNGLFNVTDVFNSDDAHRANELNNNRPKGAGSAAGNSLMDKLPVAPDHAASAASEGVDQAGNSVSSTLHVASGQGFENSLQDQYGLSDEEARHAYEAMKPYLRGSDGVYSYGSDLRISSPGNFELNAQAKDALETYLRENNLLSRS